MSRNVEWFSRFLKIPKIFEKLYKILRQVKEVANIVKNDSNSFEYEFESSQEGETGSISTSSPIGILRLFPLVQDLLRCRT